jgi:hypothetical protein
MKKPDVQAPTLSGQREELMGKKERGQKPGFKISMDDLIPPLSQNTETS